MSLNKYWQNVNFGVNYPSNIEVLNVLNTTDYMFIQPDRYSITEIVNREFTLVFVMRIKKTK